MFDFYLGLPHILHISIHCMLRECFGCHGNRFWATLTSARRQSNCMLQVTPTPSTSVTTLTPGVHLDQVTRPTNCCRTRHTQAVFEPYVSDLHSLQSHTQTMWRRRVTRSSPVQPGYEASLVPRPHPHREEKRCGYNTTSRPTLEGHNQRPQSSSMQSGLVPSWRKVTSLLFPCPSVLTTYTQNTCMCLYPGIGVMCELQSEARVQSKQQANANDNPDRVCVCVCT